MAIGTPTQDDHTVRLHRLVCCIANKGATLAKKLEYGTASECDISKFEILVAMQRSLQCYNVSVDEVLASGSATFVNGSIIKGTEVTIKINNVVVFPTTANPYDTASQFIEYIVNYINEGGLYSASSNGLTITITGLAGTGSSINGYAVQGYTSTEAPANTNLSGGVDAVDEDDQCLSQEDVDSMWEYISKECDICFAPYGSEYEDPRE